MKVYAKTEYACIAVLELARSHDRDEPVRIRDIANRHGIPSRFLVQILLQLKGAGLVQSTRGAAGGYQLAKSPEQITLYEVMSVIEGQEPINSATTTISPVSRVLLKTWREIDEQEREMLRSITLADLADRLKDETEQMYYI
ncbi:MAG: Rrf2 family transcriptional regulator [Pirellulales bacterium]